MRLAALEAAGGLAYWSNDQPRARRWYGEALAIQRERGDQKGTADALYNLSFTYTFHDDAVTGEALAREALALYESADDAAGLAKVRWGLANVEYAKGPDHAAGRLRRWRCWRWPASVRSVTGSTSAGRPTRVGLAEVALGPPGRCWRDRFRDGLRMFLETDDVSGYTLVLDSLAGIAMRHGDRLRAARISGAVETLERSSGTGLNRSNRVLFGYDPTPLITDADTAAAYAEGMTMDKQAAIDFALEAAG